MVASDDGRVRLWDPTDGRLIREFVSQAAVADVTFSPDGQLVAAICTDGAVNVWDVRPGTLRFAGRHEGAGRRAVFSPSGAVLATAGQDGVRVWHVATGTPSDRMLRHDGVQGVTSIAFAKSSDGWLASAGWDSTARLWDVRTMQQIGGAMRHDAGVNGVTFVNESNLLVTTSIDGTTRTWRTPEMLAIGAPRRSASIVQAADVSRSLMIASPTQGGAVDLWSVDGERAASSLPHGGLAMVRFEPTGRFLVTAAAEGLVRIWDLAPAMSSVPRIVQDEMDFPSHVAASPDGRSVVVSSGGSPDGSAAVRVFDVATGAPFTPAMRFWATSLPVAFSPDGRRLLTASSGGDVRLWDTRTGEPLTPLLREQIPLHVAAFSPDGETFAVAGGMNLGPSGARVRRVSDGAARTEFLPQHSSEPVFNAWFSPDGRRLLTAATGAGGNIKVWDAATGHLAWAARHADGVYAALWSADGATVFTGGSDQWVRAWDASSGAPQPPVIKMLGTISSVGVTGDGTRLLSGTSGGDVRLVDLVRGGQAISAMWHKGFVYVSRFSPDGSLALTSASDRTVRLWDGRTGEPLSPGLPAGSRSATFLAGRSALAWAGAGVFVDELTIDDRSVEQLRVLAESAAGRAISASGTEVVLAAEEIETRFMAANGSSHAAPASPGTDYQRARARLAWRRGAFEEVVGTVAPLGGQGALNWPDFMRLVGAYAATGRWQDALGELRKHHARWQAAPELLYMEAVTLARLRDVAGAVQHCRAALESTRKTQHPERAYWAARACLVPATVGSNDVAEIESRIQLAYPRMSGNLGQAELRGAMLLRGGRSQEAFDLLKSAVPPDATVRASVLLVASAAARAGPRAEALNWLRRADAIPKPPVYRHMRPWLDAEADALREEVLSTLNRSPGAR